MQLGPQTPNPGASLTLLGEMQILGRVIVSSGRGLSPGFLGALECCTCERLKTALLALNTATAFSFFFSYF